MHKVLASECTVMSVQCVQHRTFADQCVAGGVSVRLMEYGSADAHLYAPGQ